MALMVEKRSLESIFFCNLTVHKKVLSVSYYGRKILMIHVLFLVRISQKFSGKLVPLLECEKGSMEGCLIWRRLLVNLMMGQFLGTYIFGGS